VSPKAGPWAILENPGFLESKVSVVLKLWETKNQIDAHESWEW
jgi:hypothetical protein